ncbi:hypothetical protein RvY_03244-2 [Ramazzottius varieornatus]|nr:hypothetical protein RvY_03244-2 [Ramazzottius varieornatus]
MFAVPLSSSGSQQQGVEPSSSTSEWGNSPSIANMASSGSSSSNLSTTGGGWGSSGPFQQQNGQQAAAGSNGGSAGPSVSSSSTPVTDALNKQPSSSNSNSSSEWMVSPSASSMVWQTTAEPSGDNNNNNRNANPWNTPNPSSSSGFPTMSGKNNSLPNGNGNGNGNGSSNGNGGGAAQQYQAANGASAQPQDKENVNPSTPVSAERTPLDNMIYREGWGQVEVKQEVPWMVPESPPPIHDDPSVWKPKANTGTEVWEKSTGHRTQPWQNQAPNTPRWISGDEEPSSLWSSAGGAAGGPLAAAPSNSANMMQSASALSGANGGGILSNGAMNASVLGSQGGRPAWTSSGSGDSSGGNISPSNQWNSDVQDQEWSEWRDPSSRGSKSEKADDGTSHWGGMDRGADRQAQMRDQQRNGMYNPPGSNSGGGGGMKKAEERQRGWQESAYGNSASMQSQAASEWSSVNGDNEWTSGANDKRSQQPQWPSTSSSTLRDQHAQQRFSPPNNMAKHAREQIYQTKQYQGLLEMGFKREEIDVAMRNSMMNYEATLNELKRRRAQQQVQQMPMQQSSANSSSNAYGDGYKSGLAGLASAGSASSQAVGQAQQSHLMQQSHQEMNKGQANRAPAVPNIEALAHQLSVAARQGIISSRLLTQPLAPQTTYLLHKLMQSHRQMQNLTAQHEMLSKQHSPNPALQQRNMQQIVMAVNKIKADISTLQKQIESVQNE